MKRTLASLLALAMLLTLLPLGAVSVSAAKEIRLNVPFFCQRSEYVCVNACLSMVEAYTHGYGENNSMVYNTVMSYNPRAELHSGNCASLGYKLISNDLQTIYNQLAAGNPVIVQREGHFSVIYAYVPTGSTLVKKDFKVLNTFRTTDLKVVGPSYYNNSGYTDLASWLSGNTWLTSYVKVGNKIPITSSSATTVTQITATDVNYPINKQTGQPFQVFGTISSPNYLEYVQCYVKNAAGTEMFWGGYGYTEADKQQKIKTFYVNSVDGRMTFASLPAGTYTYYVDAIDSKGYYVLVQKTFTVTASSTTSGTATAVGTHIHELNSNYTWGAWTTTKSATCTEQGEQTRTCYCGAKETKSIAKIGHSYKPSTCTEPNTCRNCGKTLGAALGHKYDNDCDVKCNRCGILRLLINHNYSNACDATCDTCGHVRKVDDHKWKKGACSECGAASPSKVKVTSEPQTLYFKEGGTVSYKAEATGEGLKYQWYIKNAGASKYVKSSITEATYSMTMSDKVNGRRIYCVVTDKYGNQVESDVILLRRQATITKEPATVAYAKKGAKVSVKITAKGDGLKYQWYVKSNGSSTYKKSAVTSATYSATMGSAAKNRKVYCVITDKYGKKVQTKIFTLREAASVTTQPKSTTVKKNTTAKATVKASGDGLKYTWYIKNAGSSKYTKSSVTSATYSVKMTSKVNGRRVYCVVTDKYGNKVQTQTVILKMK